MAFIPCANLHKLCMFQHFHSQVNPFKVVKVNLFKAYETLTGLFLENFVKWCLQMDSTAFGQVHNVPKICVSIHGPH